MDRGHYFVLLVPLDPDQASLPLSLSLSFSVSLSLSGDPHNKDLERSSLRVSHALCLALALWAQQFDSEVSCYVTPREKKTLLIFSKRLVFTLMH